MDKFNALTTLGVTSSGLKDAGKILGLIELAEGVQSFKDKETKTYSWDIASEIAEFLLSKIDLANMNLPLGEYLRKRVVFWVDDSLGWSKQGLQFNEDVLVKIPKSHFEKFSIPKDDLLHLLNKTWLKDGSKSHYAWLTDFQDSELDIRFFFNL